MHACLVGNWHDMAMVGVGSSLTLMKPMAVDMEDNVDEPEELVGV